MLKGFETGAVSARLSRRARWLSIDERSRPGELILSFENTMAGWYWARSERLAMSPNLLVFFGGLSENSNEDFLRLAGPSSADVGSKIECNGQAMNRNGDGWRSYSMRVPLDYCGAN